MMRFVFAGFVIAVSGAAPAAAQTLQPATVVRDSPVIDVFAGGAFKNVLGQADATSAVSGSLGLRYRGEVYVVNALVNIAGSRDTITTGYGATLLQPGTGTALNAGILDIRSPRFQFMPGCDRNPHEIQCHFGFHAYLSASSSQWATAADSAGVVTAAEIVPSWGHGLHLSYTFVNGFMGDSAKSVAMIFDVGWASRHLRGDIGMDEQLRNDLIETGRRNFNGLEIGLTVQYDLITTGITYYYFDGSIDGFSGGQLVAGASIQANLNSGLYRFF